MPVTPFAALAGITALILLGLWQPFRPPAVSTEPIWFDDVASPLRLHHSQVDSLGRFVSNALWEIAEERSGSSGLFPVSLANDSLPRIVFLSVSDGYLSARVVRGSGHGLRHALEASIARARGLFEDAGTIWLKLDIVQDVVRLSDARRAARNLAPGLHGLAFDESLGVAFLPEQVLTRRLLSADGRVAPESVGRVLQEIDRESDHAPRPAFAFRTAALFVEDDRVLPLYRGHRTFGSFPSYELLAAAHAGGDYLIRALRPQGGFLYSYHAHTGDVPPKYNILRHAGAAYALLELYQVTRDAKLLEAARRALAYLTDSIEPCSTRLGTVRCVVEEGYTKLGGNALAILALVEYTRATGDRRYALLLRDLGTWIRAAQRETGEFDVQKQSHPDGEVTEFRSKLYPGEALLALTRLHLVDRDGRWLDTAVRGALYLIESRDAELDETRLPHDHWLLYALNELHRLRPDSRYREHALRLARAILGSQHRAPPFADWRGSWNVPPRTAPAATRTEGLCAAYWLAVDRARSREADEILRAVDLGVRFQLQTQVLPETAMYMAEPQRALGGFRKSLTQFEIRIDYVQHNISSLLCLRKAHLAREKLRRAGGPSP